MKLNWKKVKKLNSICVTCKILKDYQKVKHNRNHTIIYFPEKDGYSISRFNKIRFISWGIIVKNNKIILKGDVPKDYIKDAV